MRSLLASKLNYLLLFLFLISCKIGPEPEEEIQTLEQEVEILPPAELYGDLFYDVQTKAIFEDSKTFVDVVPQENVDLIRQRYKLLDDTSTAAVGDFVMQHFMVPSSESNFEADSSSIKKHISNLWNALKRPADEQISGTLIPLPNPYIVPGGRFREIYYWDSYFTMLGLLEDGEIKTIRNMVDNFAYLINRYGFIPNGNRTYYLGRSQPPFFALMVGVLAEAEGDKVFAQYLPELEKEYDFWMQGVSKLDSEKAVKRVVKLGDSLVLNRYWDNNDNPRPESYREDIETAEKAIAQSPQRTKEQVYRDLRAAAESGWDFSSRWLSKSDEGNFDLSSIHTTDIIPVDLNALLYNLERTIAKAALVAGETRKGTEYSEKAQERKSGILKYHWDKQNRFFMDYNFRDNEFTGVLSLAAVYPLYVGIATKAQAEAVKNRLESEFLRPGGVVTTPYNTGQQWDAPNGWAPLQWLTVKGLENYGYNELAETIKTRWLKLNRSVYQRNYKMLEKYNVEDLSKESGGGEYPTQDGFGWTNGVYQKLSSED